MNVDRAIKHLKERRDKAQKEELYYKAKGSTEMALIYFSISVSCIDMISTLEILKEDN